MAPIRLVSKDMEFSHASFDPFFKFVARYPSTQMPTQKLKIEFPTSSSQGIGSSLVSLKMIFQVL